MSHVGRLVQQKEWSHWTNEIRWSKSKERKNMRMHAYDMYDVLKFCQKNLSFVGYLFFFSPFECILWALELRLPHAKAKT